MHVPGPVHLFSFRSRFHRNWLKRRLPKITGPLAGFNSKSQDNPHLDQIVEINRMHSGPYSLSRMPQPTWANGRQQRHFKLLSISTHCLMGCVANGATMLPSKLELQTLEV